MSLSLNDKFLNGFISKNNKSFDAVLYLEDGKVKFRF